VSAASDISDLQRTLTTGAACASAPAQQKAVAQGGAQAETSVRRNCLENRQVDAPDTADTHFPPPSGSNSQDRNCGQCGGPFDDTQQSLDDGTTVWLHPECQRLYLERMCQ